MPAALTSGSLPIMKTLVVGLGNPILGDDGVGWKVAEAVKERLDTETGFRLPVRPSNSKTIHYLSPVEVECLSLGGLSLMEHLLGYERAIIVDSMETGQGQVGSVRTFPLASLLFSFDVPARLGATMLKEQFLGILLGLHYAFAYF